jgi:hypothetical protein
MPLTLATPPATCIGEVTGALDKMNAQTAAAAALGGAAVGPVALNRSARASMTAAAPHPVYRLGLDDLVAGHGLDAAVLAGWRYLLEDGHRVLGFAETTPEKDTKVAFRAFNTGTFGQATRDAIEAADQLTFVQRDDFEVRVLRVPGLSLTALWLSSATAEDAFVVLPPAPKSVATNVPLTESALLSLLRPLAKQRLEFRE